MHTQHTVWRSSELGHSLAAYLGEVASLAVEEEQPVVAADHDTGVLDEHHRMWADRFDVDEVGLKLFDLSGIGREASDAPQAGVGEVPDPSAVELPGAEAFFNGHGGFKSLVNR